MVALFYVQLSEVGCFLHTLKFTCYMLALLFGASKQECASQLVYEYKWEHVADTAPGFQSPSACSDCALDKCFQSNSRA